MQAPCRPKRERWAAGDDSLRNAGCSRETTYHVASALLWINGAAGTTPVDRETQQAGGMQPFRMPPVMQRAAATYMMNGCSGLVEHKSVEKVEQEQAKKAFCTGKKKKKKTVSVKWAKQKGSFPPHHEQIRMRTNRSFGTTAIGFPCHLRRRQESGGTDSQKINRKGG